MPTKIIVKNLKREIYTQKRSRDAVIKAAESKIMRHVELAKSEMLKELERHKFTQELRAGPEAENISGSLGGRGNLFSFIGFHANDDPIGLLKELLIENLDVKTDRRVFKDRTRHKISLPNRERIFAETPMPWETGRSWVRGLEAGISGYSHYLYFARLEQEDKIRLQRYSRSGAAIQSRYRRQNLYVPRFQNKPYLSLFIKTFEKNIRRIK